jgi:uncharacterized protein (DUF885 family)
MGSPRTSREFATFVDDYFNALFEWSPTLATSVGFHQYDGMLEDYSSVALERRAARLKQLLARLEAQPKDRLSPGEAIDAQLLDGQIRAELLNLETLDLWRKNPMLYVRLPSMAIDGLIKRSFATPAARLRSVIGRLYSIPGVLVAMRTNVSEPPREFTELSIKIAEGSLEFFRGPVAQWAKNAAGMDSKLLSEFSISHRSAVEALQGAVEWLKQELPKSKGQYAIGRDSFARKLLYDEMVDTPLDRLLAIGEANLERDYQDFVATARKIDPKKTPAEVMNTLSRDHPTEKDLIPAAQRTLERIRRFIVDKKIVTIPSDVRPIVKESPPYARAGWFASMDTPGPFETNATEAYYYVTPPEKSWDARHKEEHLRLFNAPVLQIISIHEVYPGHYLQFLYAPKYPTKTRKLVWCSTNAEGWAHYAEQMMLEEGYGDGDPKIRLAQLHEALARDCRYVVGIKLHTANMTVEEGARLFVEKGFMEPANAYEEARRGTYDPTYLYYTLGKLEIYRLRDDYRRLKGSAYSLRQFHDDFIRQGAIPIALVRRLLLASE